VPIAPAPDHARPAPVSRVGLALSFLAFLSLGLPDGSLGVAWPSMRSSFGVALSALGMLLAAMMTGTLVSSAVSGFLIARLGVGRLLVVSTLFVAASVAALAWSRSWPLAVLSSLLGGLGAGAVDAGVNAHAASAFSPRAVTWLHATFGFGAMLGPMLMTVVLDRGLGWRVGYGVLAVVLGALALAFASNLSVWATPKAVVRTPSFEAPAHPRAARMSIGLGILLFFVYSGVEATCGQWAYTFLTEGCSLAPEWAGLAVSGYWGALGGGRVLFGALAARVAPSRLNQVGVLTALASGLVLTQARGSAAVAALLVMGLALAPIYPLSISETPRRVGAAWADRVIGWQVSSAYLGLAFWPSIGGLIASRLGVAALGPYFGVLALLQLAVMAALELSARGKAAPSPCPRTGE
jgi:fucose permease